MSTETKSKSIEERETPQPAPPPRPPDPTPPPPPPPSAEADLDPTKVSDENFTEEPDEDEKPPEDIVDVLKPKAEIKIWQIGKGDYSREYAQRPLSFIKKMQWFSLVGEVLDKALSGDNAMSLNSLFSAPSGGRAGGLSMADFRDADTFVQAVGKLLVHAPNFLIHSYCIWLNVPDYETEIAVEIMKMSPEEGGLSDKQGIEIIEIFIDQNYEALERFFREDLGGLQRRVAARRKDAETHRRQPRSRR
jgi:hypothetical protein